MTGTGTIVNILAILIGATAGIMVKGGLPRRFHDTITSAIGLATMFIGLSGAIPGILTVDGKLLVSRDIMIMIGCLIIGSILGEWINIELRLDRMGEWCKSKMKGNGETDSAFVDGFVTSSLLFCVGAMAIVGSLEDGLNHNFSTLFAKSVMDGVMAMIFTASLGAGVYFSVLPLAVYQGGITFLAGFIRPYLTEVVIGRLSLVGSILIFALGINLVFGKKIKIGNLLPAVFLPLALGIFGI